MRLHVVTQWKSLTSSACGSSRNSCHDTENGFSQRPPTSRRHAVECDHGRVAEIEHRPVRHRALADRQLRHAVTIGGPRALGRSALEDDVDALFVELALALDVAQALGDEAHVPRIFPDLRITPRGLTPSIICPCDSSSSSAPARKSGARWRVSTGQTISLGRLKGCDVVVDDEAASRRHCTITAATSVCVVADLQSANGTFVNETAHRDHRAAAAATRSASARR